MKIDDLCQLLDTPFSQEQWDAISAPLVPFVIKAGAGTGKTTVAAALGASAAERLGGRVLVLTVDPARRLATALGLGDVGNTPVRVPPAALAPDCRGELWVAMLDTKAGWDDLIRRHAPDPRLRDRVLSNPLYANITGRFVNSHDYIAMEQLHDLHASGEFDLLVIDTRASHALGDGGYARDWAASQPPSLIPEAIRSLWHYHAEAWKFHVGLDSPHPYGSNALSWFLQARPTSFYYESIKAAAGQA